MYVTRPLSRYLDNPEAAAEPLPEGPGSGFLIVEDEAAVERATVCCGLCRDPKVHTLPFPQSRRLDVGEDDIVLFVPVVGEPLSAGRYYVVKAIGHHAGKVLACSREEDKTRILFFSFVDDAPPRPFHHGDIYQQVEVVAVAQASHWLRGFKAVAVAPDGIPPSLLRRKGWEVSKAMRTSYDGLNDDAHGIDWPLRRQMPDLDGFGIGAGGSPATVVGKWYCPFMFIRDGEQRLKDQVKRCRFYEMTLEQSWEEIYRCDNTHRGSISGKPPDEIKVNVTVRRSTALLGGTGAVVQEGGPQVVDGVMWFRPAAPPTNSGVAGGVGLDMVVWEKMAGGDRSSHPRSRRGAATPSTPTPTMAGGSRDRRGPPPCLLRPTSGAPSSAAGMASPPRRRRRGAGTGTTSATPAAWRPSRCRSWRATRRTRRRRPLSGCRAASASPRR